MLSKVWDEITYPSPNFPGCTVEVLKWISDFFSHIMMDIIYIGIFFVVFHLVSK